MTRRVVVTGMSVVTALGDRLKLYSDILDADFFFKHEVTYD